VVDAFHSRFSARLSLPADRIDIWPMRTDKAGFSLTKLTSVLSDDERLRLHRFRTDRLRHGFIVSRGVLRMLCARYLGTDPAALRFRYGTNGKPSLDDDCSLHFNVSHAGAMILFAFARDLEIGVDVEEVRTIREMDAIAHRFFCAGEAAEVLASVEQERPLLFHTCWTRKEAFIKATGDGLSTPLDSFRVSLIGGTQARLLHINFDESRAKRWTLHGLDLPQPYVGALCYHSAPRTVQLTTL
jgi:4'-phosphopantetheinyl transferase